MAAIGGIFNTDGQPCENGAFIDMSRAMLVRGGRRREAYINGGLSIFSGYGRADYEKEGAVYCCESPRGKNIAIILDGRVSSDERDGEDILPFYEQSSAQYVAECYLKYGSDFFRHLRGEYALALWDEERGELFLLRDQQGNKPLFYAASGRRIAFASEIKGVSRFLSEPLSVDVGKIRARVLAGSFGGGCELYRQIYEIPPSGGCVCSRIGINKFSYRPKDESPDDRYTSEMIDVGFVCPDEEEMKRLLGEILFAFDHPEFDALMPTFIGQLSALKDRRSKKGIAIPDPTMCMDIDYSIQRRDRLSSMIGVCACCIPPQKNEIREKELKKTERILQNILSDLDNRLICCVFGENWHSLVAKERNTAKRIRSWAMICQTVMWYENFNVEFV